MIQVTSSQINAFILMARKQWGVQMGLYAQYVKYGDKQQVNQFNCYYMIGKMLNVICEFQPQVFIGKVRASVLFDLTTWNPVGTFDTTISITSSPAVNFVSTGQTSKANALTDIVSIINASGTYNAQISGNSLVILSPDGDSANGITVTITTTSGVIADPAEDFSGGIDEEVVPAVEDCITYNEMFQMMEYIAKKLGFSYNINHTPSLS